MSARYVRLLAVAILALALLLPGCFDYELKLALQPHCNGVFSAILDLPAGLAQDYPKGPDEILKPKAKSILGEPVGGTVSLEQRAKFGYLSDLETKRVRFKLERVDLGLLGMRADTYRLTGWLRSLEGDRPDRDQPLGTEMDDRLPAGARPVRPSDPAAERARELLTATLAGHFVIMSWTVPGKIVHAWGLNIGGQRVEPQVDAAHGLVVWRVPLALLANARVRHTLIFRADFKANLSFKAANIHGVESSWLATKPPSGQAPAAGKPGASGPAPPAGQTPGEAKP